MNTAAVPPVHRHTLGDLLHRSAARHPHKLAVACGDTRWTYAEFDALCDRVAAGLAERGVAKGDRFAILARNSHGFAALRFALARIGAVLVPINFMLKADEAAYILRHAGAKWLATDSGLADLARAAAAHDTAVEHFVWLPSEEPSEPVAGMTTLDELAAGNAALPPVALCGSDLAQIVYTSGTESLPKGAMLTHDAVMWQYVSCVVDASIAADDFALHALPLYHCAQLDVFFGPAIYVGSSNVITAKPTPDNLLPLIAQHRITSFFAPPTVWIALLRSPLFDTTDLSSLKKGYYGASIMPVAVMQEIVQRLPQLRAVEPLRPDRDRAAGHHARPRGPVAQARLLRSRGDQCRNPRGGRCDERSAARRQEHRRDRAPQPATAGRLLPRRRTHRRRLRRRLVPFGRPRHDRRRGLHQRRRPQEGHDQERRRERRQPRGRRSDLSARRRQRSRGHRPAASALGRGGGRGDRLQGRRCARRSCGARALQRAPGRRSSRPSASCSSMPCRRTRAASS